MISLYEQFEPFAKGALHPAAPGDSSDGTTDGWQTPQILAAEAVVSLACGVGVQFTAEKYNAVKVYPGLDTCFMGAVIEQGHWAERCQGCGQCILDRTAGICPISRCAKRILNGPCGGSANGKCEISTETDCAWQLIFDRLQAMGRSHDFERLAAIKDWSTERAGGPRKLILEDEQP